MKIYSYIITAVIIQFGWAANAQNSCADQMDSVLAYIKDTNHFFATSQEKVKLEEAVMKTYLYNLWCKAIPKKITKPKWNPDDSTYRFTFEDVTLKGRDAVIFRNVLEQFYCEGGPTNCDSIIPDTLRFSYNTEALSYFIKQSDIDTILTSKAVTDSRTQVENEGFINIEKGVRVYVGVQNIQPHNQKTTASHVYVVPQIKYTDIRSVDEIIYRDVYFTDNGKVKPYILDLTTPCPNACGTNESVLNWSRLGCFE